ncbi:type IV pili methyl-accepting chemotaxis transducer N-terminal domain-containing protein [Sulfurospirillum sp. 1612]|uniref:type IV pili methyl-accepting chemotaxis transducer N-terminal domain-containing protein n=1 Tax=Sulfurospirillum sp. 1612 TaxID=3094835 RepID=UPI002F94A4E2
MFKLTGINKKIKVVGGLLSLIVVLAIIISVLMNERSKKDSLIINIAGKQRMLTQKISKEVFYNVYKMSTDFRVVDASIYTFENNLHDLIYGNSANGIYPPQNIKITEKLKQVHAMWIPLKEKIVNLEKNLLKMKPDLDIFTFRIDKMLDLTDTVVQQMVKDNLNQHYIDLSGRQRMLSQRMSLFLKKYLRTSDIEDYNYYLNAKKLYNTTITSFLNDTHVKAHKTLYGVLEKNYTYWKEFEAYAQDLIHYQNTIDVDLKYIYNNNIKVLNAMDEAVWLFTDYSEQKNMFFIYAQFLLLSVGLVIILYSFLLSKEIMNHIDDFVADAKMLATSDLSNLNRFVLRDAQEDELKEVSNHISSFVTNVNNVLKHSQDAIEKAEKAVLELEMLSESASSALLELDMDEEEKSGYDKKISATEDIAIESTENLLHVTQMLKKLKANLNSITEITKKKNP